MDFTKLLKHCEAEHGIKLDTSNFTDALLYAIYRYFDNRHGKTLLHTEQWDIFETLQERPKPGNPPPIVAEIKRALFDNMEMSEPMEPASWVDQHGVLLSNRDALAIVEFCERVNAAEQLPDPVIYPRPDWDKIDTKFNWVAADAGKDVYAFAEKPQFKSRGVWQDGGESEYLHEINFGKMLWQRPKKLEKQPSEQTEKVAEITPDYGTGFRPNWKNIDPEYNAIAIDKSGKIYLFTHKPRKDAGQWWINSGMGSGTRRYPFTIKGPVENWCECLWIRPGHGEKEGAE